MKLTIDFETRSPVDIRKKGAFVYAEHPETDVMCLAMSVEGEEPRLWIPAWVREIIHEEDWYVDLPLLHTSELFEAIQGAEEIEAHNAQFEQVIWKHVMERKYDAPPVPLEKWFCSAAMASAMALPRSLDAACKAMDLCIKKDAAGHRLMLDMSKPRKARKAETEADPEWASKLFWFEEPERFQRLFNYCLQDVRAEVALSQALPPLSEQERKVWLLDQKMNWRGIHADIRSAENITFCVNTFGEKLKRRLPVLSEGIIETPNQVSKIVEWVHSKHPGLLTDSLTKASVEAALAEPDIEDEVRQVLEIRRTLALSSPKKLRAVQDRASGDSRIRGQFLYHGATTGRWSGAGLQPQNLPRGFIKNVETPIEAFNTRDMSLLDLLYGEDVAGVASSCIRSMLMAGPGKDLVCADFSSIEARVLLWLAGEEEALEVFRSGGDIYLSMAETIYGYPCTKKEHPVERQVGKQAILGLGYGMGIEKFEDTCRTQARVNIGEEMASRVVKTYRAHYAKVPKLWSNQEKAAMVAVETGKTVRVGKVMWATRNNFLHCRLPSGRLLAYRRPQVKVTNGRFGPRRELRYMAPRNAGWCRVASYGGLIVENIVQAIARDLIAEAMLRAEERGYPIILTVHDEAVAEVPEGFGSVEEFESILAELPDWAEGCPVAAEGWRGKRYRK